MRFGHCLVELEGMQSLKKTEARSPTIKHFRLDFSIFENPIDCYKISGFLELLLGGSPIAGLVYFGIRPGFLVLQIVDPITGSRPSQ
jgi:hypothetical protein